MEYVPYLLIGAVLIIFIYVFWQTSEWKKYVTGAVLCTVCFENNTSDDIVLPTKGRLIMPPTGRWMKKKFKKVDWGVYKLPELPQNITTAKYPLSGMVPNFMKVEVRRVFLRQIDAFAFEVFNPRDQNTGIDPRDLQAMINEELAASLLRPDSDAVKGAISGKPMSSKHASWTFYLCLVILGAIIIVGALCFLIFQALNGHISAWGA